MLGYSPLGAAVGIVPPTGGFLLTPFSPRLAQRFGRPRAILAGLALCAAGTATAAVMAGAGQATYATFAVGAAITWCGMGLAMAPPTELIIEAVPAAKQGVASAVNDLARSSPRRSGSPSPARRSTPSTARQSATRCRPWTRGSVRRSSPPLPLAVRRSATARACRW